MSARLSSLVMLVIFLSGCPASDRWHGTVYPDRHNLKDAVPLGSFSSRIQCAVASINVLAKFQALKTGDYECGRNCKKDEAFPALFVCDTTEKPINPALLPSGTHAVAGLHKQCMARIHELHKPDFLTLPVQEKAKFGIGKKEELDAYSAFVEAVACVGVTSTDVVPRLGMSPTEFRTFFNAHAKTLGIVQRLAR